MESANGAQPTEAVAKILKGSRHRKIVCHWRCAFMKELVEVIAKALIDDPESVVVNEREERRRQFWKYELLNLSMGKSNRKTGPRAKAIRSVVNPRQQRGR